MANLSIIKELIRKNGFTIKSFAEEINISEQGLQKLIRENSTKVDTLERIAKRLNVSPMIFFDEDVVSPLDSNHSEQLNKLIENNSVLSQTVAKLTEKLLETMEDRGKGIVESA